MNNILGHIKRGRLLTIVAIGIAVLLFMYYRKKKADQQAAIDAANADPTNLDNTGDTSFDDPNTDLTGQDNPYDMGQYASPGGIPTDIFGSGINSANPYPPAVGTGAPINTGQTSGAGITVNVSPAGGGPPDRQPIHHPGSGSPASTTGGGRIDTHTGAVSHQDLVGLNTRPHPKQPSRIDRNRRRRNRRDL